MLWPHTAGCFECSNFTAFKKRMFRNSAGTALNTHLGGEHVMIFNVFSSTAPLKSREVLLLLVYTWRTTRLRLSLENILYHQPRHTFLVTISCFIPPSKGKNVNKGTYRLMRWFSWYYQCCLNSDRMQLQTWLTMSPQGHFCPSLSQNIKAILFPGHLLPSKFFLLVTMSNCQRTNFNLWMSSKCSHSGYICFCMCKSTTAFFSASTMALLFILQKVQFIGDIIKILTRQEHSKWIFLENDVWYGLDRQSRKWRQQGETYSWYKTEILTDTARQRHVMKSAITPAQWRYENSGIKVALRAL